jgi:hypothetical protein
MRPVTVKPDAGLYPYGYIRGPQSAACLDVRG